MTYKLVAYFNY